MTDPWPLSAAATAMLRNLGIGPRQVLELALRELILCDAWQVEERRSGFLRRRRSWIASPGGGGVPDLAPLPAVHRALDDVIGDERPFGEAVRAMLRREPLLASRVAGEVRAALEEAGLVQGGRRPRTPAGEDLRAEAERRLAAEEGPRLDDPALADLLLAATRRPEPPRPEPAYALANTAFTIPPIVAGSLLLSGGGMAGADHGGADGGGDFDGGAFGGGDFGGGSDAGGGN